MRIWMISEHADPLETLAGADAGGQNVHVGALATALGRRGHEVTVFTRWADRASPTRQEADGYTVERLEAGPVTRLEKDALLPHMAQLGDALRERMVAERPDLVHAHYWMSGMAGLHALVDTDVPLVQTFHALGSVKRREQGAADTSPDTRVALERRLCREVHHVIATCRDEVGELTRLGTPTGRCSVVPCGVDPELFRPRPSPRPDGRLRLLDLGRLVPRKGVDDVIRAVASVPAAELVVAGGPSAAALDTDPEVRRLRALADELGVARRVRFTGAVPHDEVPALIGDCDAVVIAPWYEPFGIVPLEAMASGRPIVGTAVGGLLDTVVPEVGRLVPPRDPAALADTLLELADPELRIRCGRAGRARVLEHYTWDRVAAATEDVYRAVATAPTAQEALR